MARVSGIVSEFEGAVCARQPRAPLHTVLADSCRPRSSEAGVWPAGCVVLCRWVARVSLLSQALLGRPGALLLSESFGSHCHLLAALC